MTEPPASKPPSEATASAGASTTPASPSEATASAGASTTPASPASAPGKRVEKVDRAVEKVGIMTGKVWQFLKQIWEFLKENWKYGFGILSRFIKGTEKSDPDKFWEENAYGIIRAFGTLGVAVLLVLVALSPLLHAILDRWGISGKEIVRNTYYLLIFIGAGLAASIATWRGRQFE